MARFKVKLKATAVRDPKQDHPTYRINDPVEWFEFFGEKGIAKRRSLFECRSEDGEFKPHKMTKGICLNRQTPPTPQDLKGKSAVPVTIICDSRHLEQLENDRLNVEILSSEKVDDEAPLGLVAAESPKVEVVPEVNRHAKVERPGRSA